MRTLLSFLVSLSLCLFPAVGQAQPVFWSVNVRGLQMNCTSNAGEAVAIAIDPTLNNVGIANRMMNGLPIIVFNPNVVGRFSNIVAQWWFAHECAHHALPGYLNSETNADCFAVRQLRDFGILRNAYQLQRLAMELSTLPGSPATGHLPGPLRSRRVVDCSMS